jgi:hypothetical protein
MKRIPSASVVLAVLSLSAMACGGSGEANGEGEMVAAAGTVTMESMAGDYSWVLKTESGDSVMNEGTSRQEVDGSGWSVSNTLPADTTRYTAQIVGDSVVMQSAPYTDPALPPEAGQVMWRMTSPATASALGGPITISPAARPDTVLMRAQVVTTRR